MTIVAGLRVRSAPSTASTSLVVRPLLPLGTTMEVIGGPASGSGYTWYEVRPLSFDLRGGRGHGWVAASGRDGTPWLAMAPPRPEPHGGTGTATLDGVIAPDEWAGAWAVTFDAPAPPEGSGLVVQATMLVMNDATDLFLALVVPGSYDTVCTGWEFDGDDDGRHVEDGEDVLVATYRPDGTDFYDDFRYRCPDDDEPGQCGPEDTDPSSELPGGTSDGAAASGYADGRTVIEVQHPLASGDVLRDIQVGPGDVFGLDVNVMLWGCGAEQCVTDTYYPAETMLRIRVMPSG